MNLPPRLATCFIAAFCAILWAFPAFAHPGPGDQASSYLVRINGKNYQEKNPHQRRAPASLTKMMTALVVLEHCRLDEPVTVSAAAARETGSRIGLRRGEKFRVRDLLAAALIASANDAARALADHAGGNQRNFVRLMNARAQDLGLRDTRFTNACGHDNRGLYTSAHDLAVLAEAGLGDPLFSVLVAQRTMRISSLNSGRRGGRSFTLRNKNRLIGRYPGAQGVKTGTTPKAGQCLVAVAQRDDKKVLLVVMNARNRWRSAPAMLDAAFAASPASAGEEAQQEKSAEKP